MIDEKYFSHVLIQVLLLEFNVMKCQVLVLIIFLHHTNVVGSRVKRHLVFTKGSRLFFSVDVRDNLFDYTNFFAQVIGFKIDWDLPDRVTNGPNGRRMQRRDFYQGIECFLNQHKLNGSSCVRKFICEAMVLLPKSNSFLVQLYQIIFTYNDEGSIYKVPKTPKACQEELEMNALEECPLSLLPIVHGSHADFHLINN